MRLRTALLICTAIVAPSMAQAAPVVLFFQGVVAGIGGLAVIPGIGGAFAAGVSVGAFLTSGIGALLLNLGASLLFRPKTEKPTIADALVNVRLPAAPRWQAGGTASIGGALGTFAEHDEAGNFWFIVAHADEQITGDPTYYLDGIPVTISDGTDGFTAGDVTTDEFCRTGDYSPYEGEGTKTPCFAMWTVTPDPVSAYGSNLISNGSAIDHADWTKTRAAVSANATTDPILGNSDVDLLRDDSTSAATHFASHSFSFTAGSTYRFLAFVKSAQATARSVRLALPAAAFEAASEGDYSADFDLTDGTVAALANLASHGVDHDITPIGGGWYRVWVKATAQATTTAAVGVYLLDEDLDATYDGDGASGIYLTRAQCRTVTAGNGAFGAKPSAFTTAFSNLPADFYLAGVTYTIVRCNAQPIEHYSRIMRWRGGFGLGEPSVQIVGNFGRMFDPREAGHDPYDPLTWTASDGNPAILWAWWRTKRHGRNAPMTEINWSEVEAAADICDATRLNRSAESIPTYRCGVAFPDDRPRAECEQDILLTMDGFVAYDSDGRAYPVPGHYYSPTIAFTATRDIVSAQTQIIDDGETPVDGVVVNYISPDHGYTKQPSAPWFNDDWFDGTSTPNFAYVDILGCQDHSQAFLLAKAIGQRSQSVKRAGFVTGLRGMLAKRERIVDITYDADFTGDFEIVTPVERGVQSYSFAVVPVASDRWTVNAPVEEGEPPAPTPALNLDTTIEQAANVSVTAAQIALATGNGVRLEATFDAPARDDRVFRFRFVPTAGGAFQYFTTDMAELLAYSPLVDSGTEYRVSWQTITPGGRANLWSDERDTPEYVDITPAAAGATPGTLTVNSATPDHGRMVLVGIAGSATAGVRLYSAATNDFGAATDVSGILSVSPLVAFTVTAGDPDAADIVSNGGFDDATDWIPNTGWSIGSGVATKTAGSAENVRQLDSAMSQTLEVDTDYRVTFTVAARTAGQVRAVLWGSTASANGTYRNAVGTYSEMLTVTGGDPDRLLIQSDASFAGSVDDAIIVPDTAECLPLGESYYWLVPVSAEGIEGAAVALGQKYIT